MPALFALTATILLIALATFQIALILGVPLGNYAWGGKHAVLPKNLRIASSVSIVLYAIFALFILSKANIVTLITSPNVLNVGMLVFTVYFFLGIAMNAISRSKRERLTMTPIAVILAVSFLIVTLT